MIWMQKQVAGEGRRGELSRPQRLIALITGQSWLSWLVLIGLIGLIVWTRLTALNQYLIVDEADRWRWAENFVYALTRGDLAGTRVGDGYPGIVPVWAESVWILLEAARRSLVEGQWLGEAGLAHLFHEWDRTAYLAQQRLPIVLLNTVLTLTIIGAVWRLFGKPAALVSGLLMALDPFYLSDSRVNRAEAVIAGLMTLSMLSLIFYSRQRRLRYVVISGLFGGLSFLTKIQALALLPAIGLSGLLIYVDNLKAIRNQKPEDNTQPNTQPNTSPASQSPTSSPRSLLLAPRFSLPALRSPLPALLTFAFIWTAAACLIWFILWPSMWVTPLETLSLVYNYTAHKVGTEGVNLFFWGQTYQDADPGPLFYPVVFFMRITPLALLGLAGAGVRFILSKRNVKLAGDPFAATGSSILVIYVLTYAFIMTIGSHKQDRYLMPVFLSLDILAGLGLVYLWTWLEVGIRKYGVGSRQYEGEMGGKKDGAQSQSATPKLQSLNATPQPPAFNASRFTLHASRFTPYSLLLILVIIQLATVLPHHPYYYSYFNPLFGGGQTAVRILRIGWGEGMDQVGAYLAAKPDSENLVVSSRFTHNMLGFKGQLISQVPSGRWTQADYIVLYIQQVQRGQDPTPGFIQYFQSQQPEKVIRLGGIDYAWIYPIPFTTPANPKVSVRPGRAALLGYRWEPGSRDTGEQEGQSVDSSVRPFADSPIRRFAHSQIRLVWENLGMAEGRQLVVRLVGAETETEWTACEVDPAFIEAAQVGGALVESVCRPDLAGLAPAIYTVEFGLAVNSSSVTPDQVETFVFPEGWQAARIDANGDVADTGEFERLEAIANHHIPPTARRIDRFYDGRIRLAAYELKPAEPRPGDTLEATLYWQAAAEVREPVHLITQLADSRNLPLGRTDSMQHAESWLPGEVVVTQHKFELAPELDGPLAARIEVKLKNEAEIFLQPTTAAGEAVEPTLTYFTVAPPSWPTLAGKISVEAVWPNELAAAPAQARPDPDRPSSEIATQRPGQIMLRGYTLTPEQIEPGQDLTVTLYWQTGQPIAGNLTVFIHLLDEHGQIRTQHDSLPRAGAYPTPWWQPDLVIEDGHTLTLPADLPDGTYQLVVGLYRAEDSTRWPLTDGNDAFNLASIEIQ